MTEKRKRRHSHSVKQIPSTQLNVKQIEKQLSRDSERVKACSTRKETNARNTIAKTSEELSKSHKGCSSDSRTGRCSHQNRYCNGNAPKQTEDNRSSKTCRPVNTPSDDAICPLASKQPRLQSTSGIFDRNINAGRSERTKSSDQKCKCSQRRVGRPQKTSKSLNDDVVKLPVIPVLTLSLTDVESFHNICDGKRSPSRYRVTPYPFECTVSSPRRKSRRSRRTSKRRSGSNRTSCSSERRRSHKRKRKHRAKSSSFSTKSNSSTRSSSSTRSCLCKCTCSTCQNCTQKTHRRSRSNSEEHTRRKRGSLEKPRRSESDSDQDKSKPPDPKETPTEKTGMSPDATKTVRGVIEQLSNVFGKKKESKSGNARVKKKTSKSCLEQDKEQVSRKSRSRSPKRRPHRKRASTREDCDSSMMCRLM